MLQVKTEETKSRFKCQTAWKTFNPPGTYEWYKTNTNQNFISFETVWSPKRFLNNYARTMCWSAQLSQVIQFQMYIDVITAWPKLCTVLIHLLIMRTHDAAALSRNLLITALINFSLYLSFHSLSLSLKYCEVYQFEVSFESLQNGENNPTMADLNSKNHL